MRLVFQIRFKKYKLALDPGDMVVPSGWFLTWTLAYHRRVLQQGGLGPLGSAEILQEATKALCDERYQPAPYTLRNTQTRGMRESCSVITVQIKDCNQILDLRPGAADWHQHSSSYQGN